MRLPRARDDVVGFAIATVHKFDVFLERSAGCRCVDGLGFDGVDVTTELAPGEPLKQRYAVVGRGPDFDRTGGAGHEYGEHGTWRFEIELP